VYSYLRVIQCAALISFGVIIGVGVPPLLVTAIQRPLVGKAGISDGPAVPCDRHVLLRSDQNCLRGTMPRRDMPWATAVEVASIAENVPEHPLTENRDAAPMPREPRQGEWSGTENTPERPLAEIQDPTVPQELAQGDETKEPKEATSVSPAAPTIAAPAIDDRSKADTVGIASVTQSSSEKPLAENPDAAAVSQQLARESDIDGPERAMPASPAAGEKRHGPSKDARVRVPASKNKTSDRADRAAKRSTDESVRAVRRFGDALQDIPISAYAPDGAQRRIVIRPRSVQDVYYYSVPR
jgi:hypothetical protein